MAFINLQGLGKERFDKLVNLLMRGEPAKIVARQMLAPPPDGWGVFPGMAENTLTQQLCRLRKTVAAGALGKKAAEQIAEGHTPQIKALANVSGPVLERMEELADTQRTLVLGLMEKATAEKRTFKSVNDAADGYRETLLTLQELRFKLGLDEYKGPVGSMRGVSQTTTYPDGSSVQKQVFEAITTVEKIFDARKIPHTIAPTPERKNARLQTGE